jgi:cytochrome P450
MVSVTVSHPLPRDVVRPLPLRALLAALRGNALASFPKEAFTDDVVVQRFLGRRHIIVNRADGVRRVLVDNAANYVRAEAATRILRPMFGRGLFLSSGNDWREQRRTLAPGFAPRAVRLLAGHVADAMADLVEELRSNVGQPIDLLPKLQCLALEIIGRAMFSLDMKQYAPELRELIYGYAGGLGRPSLADFLMPLSIPSPADFARRRFRRRWRRLVESIIAERARRRGSESNAPRRDLFDVVAESTDATRDSVERLGDQVATIMVAGHETTASAMFWALYLLASHSAEQERLAAEATVFSLAPEDASETVTQLIATRAVVDEVLRLYPPAFVITRQAIRDDFVAGVPVPARSLVLIAPWTLHRHRRFWTDPDQFDPARFLPGAPEPPRFAYLPFGTGSRTCIGQPFALTELVLVLAMFTRNFSISLAPHQPISPVGLTTIQPDRPLPFVLLPRHAG